MFGLPWITLVRFVVWLVIGMVIYFLYSQRSSRLQEEVER
jgi:APA family basic amino acid/polyamine antiporter